MSVRFGAAIALATAFTSCAPSTAGALAGTYYGQIDISLMTSSGVTASQATVVDGRSADLDIGLRLSRAFQDDTQCHLEGNLHGAMHADLVAGQQCQIGDVSFTVTSGTIDMDIDFHLLVLVDGEATDARGVTSAGHIRFDGDG